MLAGKVSRSTRLPLRVLIGALVLSAAFVAEAWAFFPFSSEQYPQGDAFGRSQADPAPPEGHHRGNEMGPPPRPSLNPQLTTQYNEPHPFPDYLMKFVRSNYLPDYYRDLLTLEPDDNVQSKVFDTKAFGEVRRIGIYGFENKTYEPYKNERAAAIVTEQMYSAFVSATSGYTVIPPVKMDELAFKLKLQTSPATPSAPVGAPHGLPPGVRATDVKLPFTPQDMDAVMIGAVTKFMNTYEDREGNLRKSLNSGIEFGAFLVSTRTGEIIWAARYVGGQPQGFLGLFQTGEEVFSWSDPEEASRQIMKRVIREFHKSQGQQ